MEKGTAWNHYWFDSTKSKKSCMQYLIKHFSLLYFSCKVCTVGRFEVGNIFIKIMYLLKITLLEYTGTWYSVHIHMSELKKRNNFWERITKANILFQGEKK